MVPADGASGALDLFVVLAIVLGAAAVALITPSCIGAVNRLLYQVRARERLAGQAQKGLPFMLFGDFCRNGVPLIRPVASKLMRLRRVKARYASVSSALEEKVPGINPRSFCEFELAASAVVALVLLVLTAQPALALAGMMVLPFVSTRRASTWHRTNQIRLREQLPDALNAIGMCFSAGHSLQQALGHVAIETPDPLGRQLRKTVNDIDVGYGVPEALGRLEKRTECADLHFVLVALEIHHMTGGSLRELLEGAATSISESFELMRSLEVQTAQARMSARIVTIMPLALLVVLSLAMPGYLMTFFSSTAGFMLLIGALGLEVLGILLIRRILGVDLE